MLTGGSDTNASQTIELVSDNGSADIILEHRPSPFQPQDTIHQCGIDVATIPFLWKLQSIPLWTSFERGSLCTVSLADRSHHGHSLLPSYCIPGAIEQNERYLQA